jgi:hypothetical protein
MMPTTDGFRALVADSGICFGGDYHPERVSAPGTWTDLLTGTTVAGEVAVGPTDGVALLPAGVEH